MTNKKIEHMDSGTKKKKQAQYKFKKKVIE